MRTEGETAGLRDDLERERRRSVLLSRVALELARTLRLDEILPLMVSLLRELIDFDAVGIYLHPPGSDELNWFYGLGYPSGSEEQVRLKLGQGAVGWAAQHEEALILPDAVNDERYLAARPETRSEMIVPLVVQGQLVGIFNLENDCPDAFRPRDLELLQAFGLHAGIAIQRAWLHAEGVEKHRLEEELAIARRIQLRLLPARAPEIPGFDVAAFNHPSLEVSGDLYDFLPITPDQVGLIIGDVAGKGVAAGLLMATFRASLRAEIRNNYAISVILAKVNRLMWESVEKTDFVTAVYGVLDWPRRRLTYSNAGHNPPILLRAGGGVELLEAGGPLLGAFPDSAYQEAFVDLGPGDLLVFYTDGITEASSPEDEMFGIERLIELLATRRPEDSARAICERILEAVRGHGCEVHAADDLTAIVMRVLPPGGAPETD
jgi:sigma-B regulation protein RsbU (phosphoserine phosphatase)